MTRNSRFPVSARLALASGLMLLLATSAGAQGVFKCTVGGKTVYQATACEGQGKAVDIPAGPSEQDIQAAKDRANADKTRAMRSTPPAPPPVAQGGDKLTPRKVDCAKLDQQRQSLIGRRNGTMRESRKTNLDMSAQVDRDNDEIRRLEGMMAGGGCKVT